MRNKKKKNDPRRSRKVGEVSHRNTNTWMLILCTYADLCKLVTAEAS